MRIYVDYSGGYQTLNLKRFGAQFEGKIANPDTFLFFKNSQKKEKHIKDRDRKSNGPMITVSGGLELEVGE